MQGSSHKNCTKAVINFLLYTFQKGVDNHQCKLYFNEDVVFVPTVSGVIKPSLICSNVLYIIQSQATVGSGLINDSSLVTQLYVASAITWDGQLHTTCVISSVQRPLPDETHQLPFPSIM